MGGSQGFTLIELMVVIAVVAIISTMAIPAFNSINLNQNLKKSTNTLVQEIKAARTKAVLEKREITLKLASSATNTATVLNWVQDGSVNLKATSDNIMRFDGNGVLVTAFRVIELCKTTYSSSKPTSSKKITLTRFGQVEKVEDGSCS